MAAYTKDVQGDSKLEGGTQEDGIAEIVPDVTDSKSALRKVGSLDGGREGESEEFHEEVELGEMLQRKLSGADAAEECSTERADGSGTSALQLQRTQNEIEKTSEEGELDLFGSCVCDNG